ncbi:hypothetical protein E2R66_02275 [Mucilaginibacter psychrotolerans]|uniref:DUF6438 domain-containing protein n=1 Tax=Mucilaginibacter psychrotolerans TaxID=1524096 RepID=A0A4Y8SN59_9SPHI|nr:hypothetical protein E2R66_02275 [Mucilaginibacter psychrotolerans]
MEVAHSGYWSTGGAATAIDSTLHLTYYGRPGIRNLNYYEGTIDTATWNTLNRKLASVRFKSVDAIVDRHIADIPTYELIVYWKNGKRRLVRDFHAGDSVLNTIRWLDSIYRHTALKPAKKPAKLETTFQNPPAIPKEQAKFPWPK